MADRAYVQGMGIPFKPTHPTGEVPLIAENVFSDTVEVDTFAGKSQVECDQNASVTPMGQLPFSIQFLKLGGRFEPWVND